MATPAGALRGYTTTSYFGLLDQGLLSPDDRVELLDGLVDGGGGLGRRKISRAPCVPTGNLGRGEDGIDIDHHHGPTFGNRNPIRSEEHTSELQSH